ncbi:MAG: ImmA/IrrE family metallo-endopeptidase [Alphaproteobacteria bacterium]|nr:ImmA/IrrE family metallo-endopeptidase [Alphaproteobacteria bacterium]
MTPSREEELEDLAEKARCKLTTYDALPLSIRTILDRLGDLGGNPRPSYEVKPASTMPYEKAYTSGDERKIYLSDITYEEALREDNNRRFIVAHEVAHIILNHKGVRAKHNDLDLRRQAGVRGAARDENEANYLAAALLIPRTVVDGLRSPEDIARLCGVPLRVAQIRAESANRLQRRSNGGLRTIPDRTQSLMNELFLAAGLPPRFGKPAAVPRGMSADIRRAEAALQGYLPDACPTCGHCRLVKDGGCRTCTLCGDSDCF